MARLSTRALQQDSAYRAIFEASSDGLVINDADTGVVLEANPAFCQMHGYDQMAGLHPTAFIHPNSHRLFDEYVQAIRAGNEFRTRAQDVRRDGSVFDVEVLGRGFTYQGRLAMLGVVRDVSEQVRAYQVLEDRVAERTREIERRQRVSEALGVLLSVVNSKRSLDDMLSTIVDQAGRLLGSDAEALYLIENHNPALLRLQASRNIPPGGESTTLPVGAPIVGLAAQRLRPVVAADLSNLVSLPMVADVDGQIADRGLYLEVVRRGPMAANNPQHERANRLMAEHFRSLCAVPLIAQGNSHGALMLAFRKQHLPGAEELELIRAYATQAGLAIENARLQARADQGRREADRRRRVAEGLRDLIAIVNSGQTLDDILSAVLAQADLLLGSVTSAVYLLDEDSQMLELRAVHGPHVDRITDRIPVGMPASGLAVRRLVPVAITDQRTAAARAREPAAQFAHLAQAHGAVLAVPLIVDGKACGTITLFYPEPRDFGDEDVQLSTAFADQASQAIENARLRNEAEERFRELEALYSADATLHRSLQVNEVLEALVGVAVDILSADNSAVFVWDAERSSLSMGAAVGFPQMLADHVAFAPNEGAVGRVAVTGETVVIEDVQADQRASQRFAGQLGIRAGLHVPVTVGDEIFGVFTVGSRQARSFSMNERRVLAGLAQRAGVAIENARLHGESEQRRTELAALYQADEALHRSLRLNDVLETLIDVAQHLLDADGVGLWGRDPDQPDKIVPLASRGLSPDFLRESIEITRDARVHKLGSIAEMLVSEDCIRDMRFPPGLRLALAREGYRAIISTQVAVGEQVFGTFSVGMRAAHKFSESEKRLMSALSARAAQAIQNARRHEESEQQRRELQALYGADAALHRSLRLNDVLEALVDAAIGLLRADAGGLWGPDPSNASQIVPLASRGISTEYLKESVRLNDEPGVLEYWWGPTPDVLAVEDVLCDPRLPPAQRAALEREGCRSFLSIQVRAGDQQFGSFTVAHRTAHRYSDPEQRLLVALGQRAALAIQNARLYEQVQQAAAMEERQRLARELHDAVTQTLFTTALIAEVLPDLWELDAQEGLRQLGEIRRLTRGALAEMRTLLVELRPAALTEMQLTELLRQLSEATEGRTRLEVSLVPRGQPRPLPSEVQVALYRLAQEALNNVVKHAHARRASIELEYVGDDGVRLSITDDGRGFDQRIVAAGHLGLGIMRERARAIGASFQLDSRPGEGTSINMHWTQTEVSTL